MDLTKLQNDTLSQMIANDNVSSNFSPKFKQKIIKAGVISVLAATAFLSAGMARADDTGKALGIGTGLSVITGILTDGSRPANLPADCNVQGTNGYKVGGAGTAGSVVGSQIGGGNGKLLASLGLGLLSANAAQNSENNRIKAECENQLRQRQANGNNNYNAYPNNNGNPQQPQALILYAVKNSQGLPMYVTINDSPGLASLSGHGRGNNDPANDPIVQNALNKSLQNMQIAYQNLDQAAINFVSLTNGRDSAGKLSRYAVTNDEIQAGNQQMGVQRQRIEQENNKFTQAFSNYASARSTFAQIADNAAVDGFNLTGYSQALDFVKAPESVQVAYNGKNVNRYQTFERNFANR